MIVPYVEVARRTGWELRFLDDLREGLEPDIDMIAVQLGSRRIMPAFLEDARAAGKPVVHEIDDHLHALGPTNPSIETYYAGSGALRRIQSSISAADCSIVSTDKLAEAYGPLNANTHVCEIGLPDEHIDALRPRDLSGRPKRLDQIRIGWAGGNSHRADLYRVIPAISVVMHMRQRVRFVLAGHDFTELFPRGLQHRVEFAGHTWREKPFAAADFLSSKLATPRYWRLLQSMKLDIAIAPLEPIPFNESKSALKIIEYGMVGVPVLASNVGPYKLYADRAFPDWGLVCGTAKDDRDWTQHLLAYVDEPNLRASTATRNLAYINREHRISVRVEAWLKALASAAPKRP